jgi:deoxycytidylate deaminase
VKPRYFSVARKASLKSNHPNHRLGAVVAHGRKIIAIGWNKYKTNPRSPHPFKHIHAEIAALIQCKDQARGADLYVYREGKDGSPRLSKPCKHCMAAIQAAGIRRIFYTTSSCVESTKIESRGWARHAKS